MARLLGAYTVEIQEGAGAPMGLDYDDRGIAWLAFQSAVNARMIGARVVGNVVGVASPVECSVILWDNVTSGMIARIEIY